MTASELLEAVKAQFTPLYYDNETALNTLLKTALRTYQQIAGAIKKVSTDTADETDVDVDIPNDFLEVCSVADAKKKFHEYTQTEAALTAVTDSESTAPYTFSYFVDLEKYAGDLSSEDLPRECIRLVMEHLTALISIKDTARAKSVAMATNRQDEFPSDQELQDRKDKVEGQMEENMAMIPAALVI